jgi:hypothetical protein
MLARVSGSTSMAELNLAQGGTFGLQSKIEIRGQNRNPDLIAR